LWVQLIINNDGMNNAAYIAHYHYTEEASDNLLGQAITVFGYRTTRATDKCNIWLDYSQWVELKNVCRKFILHLGPELWCLEGPVQW
jgi:hypothetical protein